MAIDAVQTGFQVRDEAPEMHDLTPANLRNIMKFEGDIPWEKDLSFDPERKQLQGAVS